jgi:hypothetical protein
MSLSLENLKTQLLPCFVVGTIEPELCFPTPSPEISSGSNSVPVLIGDCSIVLIDPERRRAAVFASSEKL